MNYYQARQRKEDGLWDWTRMNDGQIWSSGSCAGGCGHATAEDAERHFYEYEAQNLRELTMANQQQRCQVCGEWTQKALEANQLGLAVLCDAHRTPDGWRQVHPFEKDLQIISSW